MTTRREFLALASQASGLVLLGALPARGDEPPYRARGNPFALGVASGDPAADGFVLWTRLGPDPLHGGGMPRSPVKVGWEVASDEAFRQVRRAGRGPRPARARALRPRRGGRPPPSRDYFYRFTAGGERSPAGHARTAPAPGESRPLAFGVASCQSYQSGYFTALGHLAEEDLDAVLHLGDYIYESGAWGRTPVRPQGQRGRHPRRVPRPLRALQERPRPAEGPRPPRVRRDLGRPRGGEQLRGRPALGRHAPQAVPEAPGRRLPGVLRAPAAPPLVDAAGARACASTGASPTARPRSCYVLDTRQYRTDQPCGDGIVRRCPGASDPRATLLGARAEGLAPGGAGPLPRPLRPRAEPGALRTDRQRRGARRQVRRRQVGRLPRASAGPSRRPSRPAGDGPRARDRRHARERGGGPPGRFRRRALGGRGGGVHRHLDQHRGRRRRPAFVRGEGPPGEPPRPLLQRPARLPAVHG